MCSGYHQESGRAGRDGRDADIVLYFSRADVAKTRSMLEQAAEEAGPAGKQQLRHNKASLEAVTAYADNLMVCRRVLLLQHFGERFNPQECKGIALPCVHTRSALETLSDNFAIDFTALHVEMHDHAMQEGDLQGHCLITALRIFRDL